MPNSNRMLISVSAAMDLLNRRCAPINKVVLIASPYKLLKIKPPLGIYCFAYSPHVRAPIIMFVGIVDCVERVPP